MDRGGEAGVGRMRMEREWAGQEGGGEEEEGRSRFHLGLHREKRQRGWYEFRTGTIGTVEYLWLMTLPLTLALSPFGQRGPHGTAHRVPAGPISY